MDIPPNVQLLYYFMTYNCNAELIPSGAALFMQDKAEPYNDKFDDQGYKSVYLLENGQSTVNNVNNVLLAGVGYQILCGIFERVKM